MYATLKRTKKLIDAGYEAALQGKPCSAATNSERDRAAWEQGWRAGNNERQQKHKETKTK